MKLRQAAALALVGWYLIGPPRQDGPANFNIHAPLTQWTVIEKYDDSGACERGRTDHLSKWSNGVSAARAGTEAAENDALMITRLNEAQCIASDDPRLKEK